MQQTLEELRDRRNLIRNLTAQEEKRLLNLYIWLEQQKAVARLVEGLRAEVDVSPLIPDRRRLRFGPIAGSPSEIRRIGLYILESTQKTSIHTIAFTLGIKGHTAQEYIDACMEKFVDPLLDWIEEQLIELAESNSVQNEAERRVAEIFSPVFASVFPQTNGAFQNIEQSINAAVDGTWCGVATLCREALQTFLSELRDHQILPTDELMKAGDVKGWLSKLVVTDKASRSQGALAELVTGAWNYTQSLVHRSSATRDEGLRAYLWTALLVAEIHLIVRDRMGPAAQMSLHDDERARV